MDPELQDQPQPQPIVQDEGVALGVPGTKDGLPMVSLPAPGAAPPQPSDPTIEKRTFKTTYGGIADLIGQTEDGVRSAIAAGQEDWIRKEAAAKIDYNKAEEQHQKIVAAANSKGGPLDPKEVATVLDPFSPVNAPADPHEVIERAYATNYVSSANTAAGYMADNFLDKATGEIPDQVDETASKTSDLASMRGFVETRAQNIQDGIAKQGWIGWSADQLALIAQPYSEYMLRGLVQEVGKIDGGVLLGTNLEATVDHLMFLPGPQFRSETTRILDYLEGHNPTLALMFAKTILGSTTSDRYLNNIFTVLAPLDVATVAGGGVKLAKRVDLFNKTQNIYKDLAKSLEIERPTKATIAESAGNVTQAATLRVSDNLIKTVQGTADPTQVGREALMSGFRQDVELLGNNIGSFTREAVTRIQDGIIRGGETLLNEAIEMSKVQRTPLALSVPENVDKLRQQLYGEFRGSKNAILDIGDPIPNELTNTHVWPVRFGSHDNLLFSSDEMAHNFAQQELKLNTQGYRVGQAEGKVEQEAAKFTGSKTDLATKERLEKSIPETEAALKRYKAAATNPRLSKAARVEAQSHITGKDSIRVILKGYKETLAAVNKRVTPVAAVVNQKGIGFYIEKLVPFNEGQTLVKDLMIRDTAGNLVPDAIGTSSASGFSNIVNGVTGWIRGANQTLSKNEMMQRNAATFSTSGLRRWASQEGQALVDIARGKITHDEVTGEPIPWYRSAPRTITGKLSPAEVKEQFVRTLKYAQDAPDPNFNGEPGYFFKTLGELESHYLTHYERPPSFNEANAYFSFVKMMEAERTLREISEYKYRSRLGVEQHQFSMIGPDGKRVLSDFVDGVDLKRLPGGSENVIVLGERQGDERLYKTNAIPKGNRERWTEEVANGSKKVIQIYATGERPLKDFSKIAGNERVVYVIADNVETKDLGYNHVNRRGGGHFDFDYDNYLKQAIVTKTQSGNVVVDRRGSKVEALYEGDRTFMPVDNRAMGNDIAKKMNEVIDLLDAKKFDAAKAKYEEHKLPIEWDKFKGYFEAKKLDDGTMQLPRYSTKEHFQVVPKGRQIIDLPTGKDLEAKYAGNFRDGTRSGDLSKQFQVEYNRERDSDRVYTFNDKGKAGRPDYEYQPASMVDPIASFDRSLNRMINSTFMDDYKIYTVEHWLREASKYMKPTEEQIRSAPFAHFLTPEWKSGLDSVDLMKKSNLLSNRYKAREFIGLPSKFDTTIHQLTQYIADQVWEANNPFKRAALLVPHWLLPYHAEPVSAVRSLAYHFKLGLYALPQIITQFNSWTTTMALEPRAGMAGTYASLLHSWAAVNSNPEVLKALDNAATKLDMGKVMLGSSRWRAGEFMEGRQELIRSGFLNVGGEMVDLDSVFNNHSVVQGTGAITRGGQKPFQWGEKAARIPAYYTAFRLYREGNPFGKLTELDRQGILHHANILTNNMTRASNSILNEGVLSLPMQFLSYQYRLGETFLGKEIGETTTERNLARARLMAGYGAMYGIPSAIGVTGIPGGDKARKYALDNFGYIPGEHWYSTAIMEGWPALFLNKATGNNYDIGGKWGTKGMTTVSDLLRGDKTWLQLVGGAGIDNIFKFLGGFDGWYKAMISFARQDPAEERFKLTFDDLVKPAMEISSLSTLKKVIVGTTLGKWVSKSDAPVMDVSKANAIFMGISGLNPTEQGDAWLKGDIMKEEKEMQKSALKSYMQDMARADMAAKNKDPEAAEQYHKNGFATLHAAGFPYEKMLSAIAQAAKANSNSIDRSDYNFYLGEDVPTDKRAVRKDTFIRSQQLKQGNQ